ncbi:hypothetical protein F1880_008423 [Penicillium rolfsii]|nr:hypothetical protein F1880_008423 [Penicillium rolfsii]
MPNVIVGSYRCTISSFTNIGSSYRETYIADYSTYTNSYAIFFPYYRTITLLATVDRALYLDEFRCCALRSLYTGRGPSKTGTTGITRREEKQNTSWMIFAAAILVFAAKIAFVRLSGQRTSWMSSQSGSRRPNYQRISYPGVQDEEDNENGVHEEARRTFLPPVEHAESERLGGHFGVLANHPPIYW